MAVLIANPSFAGRRPRKTKTGPAVAGPVFQSFFRRWGDSHYLTPTDFASLFRDVTTQLFARFDDDTVVHPGHGRDTTLGAERPHLDAWLARGW